MVGVRKLGESNLRNFPARNAHKNQAGRTPAVRYRDRNAASAQQKAATQASVLSVANQIRKKYDPARISASPGISDMVSLDQKAISGVVNSSSELQKAAVCDNPVLLKMP
jgi:hypothetical protein